MLSTRDAWIKQFSLSSSVFACLAALVMLFTPIPATSATLSFEVTDPAGDYSSFPSPFDFPSITDITKVKITFDTNTGNFEARLTSTAEMPFLGVLEPNFQFYNVDAIPFTTNPAIVRDWLFGENRFTLNTPSTTLVFAGNNLNYMNWKAGDRVATSVGFSNSPFPGPSDWPSNQGFASNFYIFGPYGTASDILPLDAVSVIASVPEPASIWFFGLGLATLFGLQRLKGQISVGG